ncbi:MAG: NAD-dependent DNA ligase LigA [Elusimicrobia bacterium]|nr:NAD-dependent DNA ligase LigA [Elusimicrobiota bacterium]
MKIDEKIRARIENLREKITRYDFLYYVKGEPEISDREYDRMYAELKTLEEEHPEYITADSPTRRVGGEPLKEFKTVKHAVPMLSLENTYSREEVAEWEKRIRKKVPLKEGFVIEEKLDGVSISVTYEKGKLILAASRGNGISGDDITGNILTQRVIPLVLRTDNPPDSVEIRGEMFLKISELRRINEVREKNGEPVFANPRNTCAGTLKLLDPAEVSERRLSAYFYGFGRWDGTSPPLTQMKLLEIYEEWGLPVNSTYSQCASIEEVFESYERLADERADRDYDIDGTVVKVNLFREHDVLGATSRNPRWAIAYKFESKKATTTVREIIFSVGRTGIITPVAKLEPVGIGGVTVSSATLHNFDQVRKLGVSAGDRVEVERGGDVIPKIVSVIKASGSHRPVVPPGKCPACGHTVKKDINGVFYRCSNIRCPAQLKQKILHYASIDAMNIEGLGENIAQQLVERGFVRNISDLYSLDMEKLLSLDLFAEKKARKLLDAVRNGRNCALSNFIYALGIQNVGKHTAKILARRFGSVNGLMNAGRAALMDIDEIGPIVSESIMDFFESDTNQDEIKELLKNGVRPVHQEGGRKLSGLKFVFTGTMKNFTRKAAAARIEALGGAESSSVTADTDYLVAGENPGSKLDKAKEKGIKIINEEEFTELAGK